jgi:hypothetical protein
MTDTITLNDVPVLDRAEVKNYISLYGGAYLLRVDDKIGSDATVAMLLYRKEHGDLPPHDFVWIEEL